MLPQPLSDALLATLQLHCICVPSNETPRIQEYHGLISHMLSELVEQALFKRESRVSGSQRIIAEIRFQEFK